jgi:50S ribosomal subunit-associated GTPase HflX
MIVYDASEADGDTINRIIKWMKELRTYISNEKPIIIVANKFDL